MITGTARALIAQRIKSGALSESSSPIQKKFVKLRNSATSVRFSQNNCKPKTMPLLLKNSIKQNSNVGAPLVEEKNSSANANSHVSPAGMSKASSTQGDARLARSTCELNTASLTSSTLMKSYSYENATPAMIETYKTLFKKGGSFSNEEPVKASKASPNVQDISKTTAFPPNLITTYIGRPDTVYRSGDIGFAKNSIYRITEFRTAGPITLMTLSVSGQNRR